MTTERAEVARPGVIIRNVVRRVLCYSSADLSDTVSIPSFRARQHLTDLAVAAQCNVKLSRNMLYCTFTSSRSYLQVLNFSLKLFLQASLMQLMLKEKKLWDWANNREGCQWNLLLNKNNELSSIAKAHETKYIKIVNIIYRTYEKTSRLNKHVRWIKYMEVAITQSLFARWRYVCDGGLWFK